MAVTVVSSSGIVLELVKSTTTPINLTLQTGVAGPSGKKGDIGQGLNILGTLTSITELPATANPGDGYLISGDLHVYGYDGNWTNVGAIQGPVGEQGIRGLVGPDGPQGIQGIKGDKGLTGPGVPVAGTVGQVLSKVTAADFDTAWADAATGGGTVTDATPTTKGVLALAGDLGGTASVPTVPNLANKANTTDLTAHTGATTTAHGGIVAATDTRLTDQRTPLDGSVTTPKLATGAVGNPNIGAGAVSPDKVALPYRDGTPTTLSLRTLGVGAQQAAAGNDSRLSDSRTPTAHDHPVGDLTATGTKDTTTFLRGDNTWAAPPAGGTGSTDHGALTGLVDDDHTQYHNNVRGDARYVGLSDTRLTDNRTPTDGSVTNIKVPAAAAINLDKTADSTSRVAMTGTERTKLTGIATAATANATDVQLRDRSTHTGTQLVSTIGDSTTVGRSVLTAFDAAAGRSAIGAGTSNLAIGTTGTTAAAGNDTRLSDSRTPTAHDHPVTDLTATGTRDATTVLHGDNTWKASATGSGAIAGDGTVTALVSLTQAAYDALTTKDPTTLYVIVAGSSPVLIGAASAGGAGTVAGQFPTGWEAGDEALILHVFGSETIGIATPAGWTLLGSPVITGSVACRVYRRTLAAGDTPPSFAPDTTAVPRARAMTVVARNTAPQSDPFSSRANSTSVTTVTAPGVTTPVANCLVVRLYGEKSSTNTGWTGPVDHDFTGFLGNPSQSGEVSAAVATQLEPGVVPTGDAVATRSVASSNASGITLLLRPKP